MERVRMIWGRIWSLISFLDLRIVGGMEGKVMKFEINFDHVDFILNFHLFSEDLRRWFLAQEAHLFKFRMDRLDDNERAAFMASNGLEYELISQKEVNDRFFLLKVGLNITLIYSIHFIWIVLSWIDCICWPVFQGVINWVLLLSIIKSLFNRLWIWFQK